MSKATPISRHESFTRTPISRHESFARRAHSFLKEAHALTRSRSSLSASEPSSRLGDLAVVHVPPDEASVATDEPTVRSSAARELDLLH